MVYDFRILFIMKKIINIINIIFFLIFNRLFNFFKNKKITVENTVDYKKIAFQIHVFYVDVFQEIIFYLEKFNFHFDLFISTDTDNKKNDIIELLKNKLPNADHITVEIVDNIGRDIYPFLFQMNKVYEEYDIICHLHTKKSKLVDWGDNWRKDIYSKLLTDGDYLFRILSDDNKIGLISPSPYKNLTLFKLYILNLLKKENFESVNDLLGYLIKGYSISKIKFKLTQYPCGNMFIARTDSIKQLFERQFNKSSFPPELGQTENTLQHTVEFIWEPLINYNNYSYLEVHK